jgi:hypothetical protein
VRFEISVPEMMVHPPSGSKLSLMLDLTSNFDTTLNDWESGTKYHEEIAFSATHNALELGEYWISLWG